MTEITKQEHFRDATEKVDNRKAQILKNAISSLEYLYIHDFVSEKERDNAKKRFIKYANSHNLEIIKVGFLKYEVQEKKN